jgi:hypothetical protein
MANSDVSFPKIADKNWWKLRELFKKKVPTVVTPSYLASALSMSESSAKANLIFPFKKIGIIDEDNKPTDLAYNWRDDNKYSTVCETLIEKNYPQELRDLFHSSDVDFQQLTNWFMNFAKCGEPVAKMFARFYLLLLKADPTEADGATAKRQASPKKPKKEPKAKAPKPSDSITSKEEPVSLQKPPSAFSKPPELHINIQLHISPETSAEQIDKIFESMAKHLKDFTK